MDDLDRIQAVEEAAAQAAEEKAHPARSETKQDVRLDDYVCRIGCIRTENGWFGLGYNEHTKSLQLLEETL